MEIELTGITREQAARAIGEYLGFAPVYTGGAYDAWTVQDPEGKLWKLNFAYGSNINLGQIAHRCPDAQVVGPIRLEDYELLFRGATRGYGVATIAPKEGSVVHGLLWNLPPESEQALDMYEGYPHLYDKELVSVRDADGRALSVMAYVMTDLPQRAPSLPSPYYFGSIQEGYEDNGLPEEALQQALSHAFEENRAQSHNRAPNRRRPGPER